MNLVLYGAGGIGASALEVARCSELRHKQFSDVFFAVDHKENNQYCGKQVKQIDEVFESYSPAEAVFSICVGEPYHRRTLWDKVVNRGYSIISLIHPNVEIPDNSNIGEGCIIHKNSFIGPNCIIGKGLLLINASIAHDCNIGDYNVIAGGAYLSGNCTTGYECYIGTGAVIKEKTRIGNQSIIGMASAVHKDIPDCKVVAGNPARIVKSNNSHRVFS